ncbi:glutathione binding-like protein [Tabrizicola sp.]|uniref:glutathione binding-like protein n=1 Tax=Tabrizicola sp. TaxID=2005166 RepID=UPI00286D3B64|nr:glutathione binding-like protein [Tabrizicola sp.]
MKLYFKPAACSMASHIVLSEIGGAFVVEQVNTNTRITASGADFNAVNPNGKVPVLEVDGEILTEGPAILQFLGDRAADDRLTPVGGTLARARVNEVLNYVGTELHVAFRPLFNDASTDAEREASRVAVAGKFAWLEDRLSDGRSHMTGENFTIADAYAFVVANWANFTGIALERWPNLKAYVERVSARPSVQRVLRAEGLIN